MKMKIYSERKYLREGVEHVVMLYPFWGKNPEHPRAPERGRFDRYADAGRSFFEMSSLTEADFAVMPAPWERVMHDKEARELALQFASKSKQAGKRTVVYFCSDSNNEVPIENSVILRTSFFSSTRKFNEFALPAWSEDLLHRYAGGSISVRKKKEKPVVGFCGHAKTPTLKWKIKNLWRNAVNPTGAENRQETVPLLGATIRARALRALADSSEVETNFVVRDRFHGGALLADGGVDFDRMQMTRLEFVQNLVESDYILCVRGAGNFSYRLYETLCCGRIPVFINTDCVLPYDFAIDWSKYCVWVEQTELPRIAEKVAEFHRNLSPEDFEDLQHNCRKLWEKWLSPQGFFANFFRHFQTMQSRPSSASQQEREFS
jgi:hypothetical protein